jgi:hypothetical protein
LIAMTTMGTRQTKLPLAVLWLAAATAGLLVALVPVLDSEPPARLMAGLLLLASAPFGLLRPSVPALWAVAIAWPTVLVRLGQDAGWQSVLLLAYTLVGLYGGDWLATWWAERYGRESLAAAEAARLAAGGPAVQPPDAEVLPPVVPGRWSAARRQAAAASLPDGPAVARRGPGFRR